MQNRFRFFPRFVYDGIVLLAAAYLSHHELIACWLDPSCVYAGDLADYSLWGMIVIAILLLVVHDGKLKPFIVAWRMNRLLGLFILYALASVAWSILPGNSIHAAFVMIASALTASGFAMIRRPGTIFRIVFGFTLLAGILSAATIIFAPGIGIHQDTVWRGAWRGIFSHKNDLGPLMALGNGLALLSFAGAEKKQNRALALLGYVFTLILAIMSRSATAVILWLVLNGLSAVYFARVWWEARLVGKSFAAIGGVIAAIAAAGVLSIAAIFQVMGKGIQLTGRVPLWSNLLESVVAKEPWFGYGLDTLWSSREFQRWASETSDWGEVVYIVNGHNGYVDILMYLGAVGLILLLLMLVQAVGRAGARALTGRIWLDVFPLLTLVYFLIANVTVSYILVQENFHWMLLVAILFMAGGNSDLTDAT